MLENRIILREISFNPSLDVTESIRIIQKKSPKAEISEYEKEMIELRLKKKENNKNQYMLALYSFQQSQKLEGELKETNVWKQPPSEIIKKVKQLDSTKSLPGFHIKNPETDIYEGVSPFVVNILPQIHKGKKKDKKGKSIYYYDSDALRSQKSVFQSLKILRSNNITAVNAWEGVKDNEHPRSMLDEVAPHAKAKNDAHVLLGKYQFDNPNLSHQSLNYIIESDRDLKLLEKRYKNKEIRRKYSRIFKPILREGKGREGKELYLFRN